MATLTDLLQDILLRPREAVGLLTPAMLRVSQAEARVLEQEVRAISAMSEDNLRLLRDTMESRRSDADAERKARAITTEA